ncbi:hypothetical protein [Mesorhizobium sp.]|uniref:hypothetical protein n=1 Tax=Mesorhizobium sp. TaxID=1871066 RepID=UPI000FEA6FE9|nr:hypothetical protein [Mesorhizobium sp.]RWA97387.1 MAG: hypothetical protein EOQ33_31860 [Mesorhizobium sp.]
MVTVGDDAGILAAFTVTLVTLIRLCDGRRRLHVRAYTLAIGGNACRFVILGRSKERSDAAQTPGSMP